MSESYKISIEGEVHSSKNSRRIFRNKKTGSPFVAKSQASKSDEALFSLQLASQREKWEKMVVDCGYPIIIIFSFRRATRRKFDYVNMAQGILDAMVVEKYIPDDCADYVIPFFTPYTIDKKPGCELMVLPGNATQHIEQWMDFAQETPPPIQARPFDTACGTI